MGLLSHYSSREFFISHMCPQPSQQSVASIRDQVMSYEFWYHCIDLPENVVTPGAFDIRDFAPRALPQSLAGLRCLDVGTFDGFWAFQMEERKAREIIAIDLENLGQIDWPPNEEDANRAQVSQGGAILGEGFRIASLARRSKVQRVQRNVFELKPSDVGGPVDFALVGTMLQHVRDPVGALVKVRDSVTPGGTVLLIEMVNTKLSLMHPFRPVADFRPTVPGSRWTWWVPNLEALKRYARTAGLEPRRGIPASCAWSKFFGDRLVALICDRP